MVIDWGKIKDTFLKYLSDMRWIFIACAAVILLIVVTLALTVGFLVLLSHRNQKQKNNVSPETINRRVI